MPARLLPSPALPSDVDFVDGSAAQAYVPTAAQVDAALDVIETGATPDDAQAEVLLHARGAALDRLLTVAGRLRDAGLETAGRPGVITYSRKVFIPLTHLCQDRCHYCIFVMTPGKLAKAGKAPYLSEEEVLEIARQGAAMGCKEALFTLGDRPEARWAVAREWLDEHGFESTLDYVRHMAVRVLEETGLLPHLNPGVMSWAEIQRLRPVALSMGMMLETTSTRLWSEKGGPHFGSPDKDPAVRLRVLEDAGRSRVPFTTGLLLGIGETYPERIEAIQALGEVSRRYGNVQEVIIQNFRAKESTAMMHAADLAPEEYAAAVAVTRLLLGPDARVQTPPNLTDPDELALLVRAGIDDWGGVSPLTPDHVNPERPWPQIDTLAHLTALSGYTLRERLTAHPHYLRDPETWFDPRVVPHIQALAGPDHLADESLHPVGRPWAAHLRQASRSGTTGSPTVSSRSTPVARVLARAAEDPAGLSDDEYVTLLQAEGADLDALAALADEVRRDRVGDTVTYAVNRNIDSSLLRAPGEGDTADGLTLDLLGDLVDEAWSAGATEICMQGAVPAHLPASAYLDLAAAVKSRRPQIHLHAFRPAEIADGATRAGAPYAEFLDALRQAGVDTVPGTGARILDDAVRAVLSGGTDMPAARWVEVVTTAHRVGLRSTATMVYGHVETPAQQVAHLRTLARVQDETGGFTELIAMPFVPVESPVGVPAGARPGPSVRETRAVHAVARLLLAGRIDHVQAAWTKIGLDGAQRVLAGGADDLGGVLLDGTLRPDAGPETGRELTVSDVRRVARELGRGVRQRSTTYGEPPLHPVGR